MQLIVEYAEQANKASDWIADNKNLAGEARVKEKKRDLMKKCLISRTLSWFQNVTETDLKKQQIAFFSVFF